MKILTMLRYLSITVLTVFVALVTFSTSFAQNLPGVSDNDADVNIALEDPESKEAVRDLVATLSDDAVRALLIQRLDAVAEANGDNLKSDAGVLAVLQQGMVNYWVNAKDSLLNVDRIPEILDTILSNIKNALAPEGASYLWLIVFVAVIVGVIAERLVTFFFRKRKQQLIDAVATTLSGILKILYTRLSFDILGVLAFAAISAAFVASFYQHKSIAYQVAYTIPATILAAWMAYVICRFFFAPNRPELRICKTTNQRAVQLTFSYSLLAAFIVFMHNTFYLFVSIVFTKYDGWEFMGPLGFLMNISLYAAAAGVLWYNRQALTEILTENKKRVCLAIGEEAPDDLSWFAINWPKIAVLLIFLKYFLVEIVVNSADVGVYSTTAVYMTFIVIFLWPGVDANVSLFVARGIRAPADEGAAAARARRSMQQGLLRVGRLLVVGTVLYSLAWLWGVNILDLAEAGFGAQAAGRLVELLFIVLFAYMTWELVSIFIGHWMAQEGGHPDDHGEEAGGEIGGVGLSRVATLLPIIRKTAQFLIVVVSIIMVLDKWGVNIGPILAGAGVVGLAVGFGAQTLVKDIVSGLFFLADDAFRVGEYVDVGGTMGNVEKISLRSLRLRHHRGLVHTVPYGEIPKLTNFSRDWVIMKLRFRVPFETDINKVKKIFKKIGNDLLADPDLGEDFLQPFKSQGVAEVDDNGIVVRGKFMAKPGKQFMIRKEVYVRVQKAFDEAGIPFARKQVMVHIPGLDRSEEVSDEHLKSIGAAAAEAAEDPLLPAR
jgi:moderate conductance mechanosensitive channel